MQVAELAFSPISVPESCLKEDLSSAWRTVQGAAFRAILQHTWCLGSQSQKYFDSQTLCNGQGAWCKAEEHQRVVVCSKVGTDIELATS